MDRIVVTCIVCMALSLLLMCAGCGIHAHGASPRYVKDVKVHCKNWGREKADPLVRSVVGYGLVWWIVRSDFRNRYYNKCLLINGVEPKGIYVLP